jgi:RNA polymerase sigma-70 factor (ECF subfamily)
LDEFAEVAERVAPRLYRMATRLCGNADEAQDLVQDTLLQAYRKWEQFQGRSDPATWMYTIAGRLCQRRHRRRAGEPTRLESLSDLLPASSDRVLAATADGEGPLDTHLRKEAERAVAAALPALPLAVRLPLVLADIAELPLGDIARILGLKPATVKTRVHRGRLQLRRVLLERLPTRLAPPADHDRQVCLDLLQAKQEALDRRAPFPYSSDELCARCRSVFSTLDLGQDTCLNLGRGALPARLRALIGARFRPPGSRSRAGRPGKKTAIPASRR